MFYCNSGQNGNGALTPDDETGADDAEGGIDGTDNAESEVIYKL